MKKTYIVPQLHVYELGPESAMMASVSAGQHTSGFGTKTNSVDEQRAGWQIDWNGDGAEKAEN